MNDRTSHYESDPWAMLQLFIPGVFGDGASKNPRAAAISATFRAIDDAAERIGQKGAVTLLKDTFGLAPLAVLLGVSDDEVAKWLDGAPIFDRYVDSVPNSRPFGLTAKIEELTHVRLALYALIDEGRLDQKGARSASGQDVNQWAATRWAVNRLNTPEHVHFEWIYKAATPLVELAVDIETEGALRKAHMREDPRDKHYETYLDFCEAARRCNAFRTERGLRPFDFGPDLARVLDRLGVLGDTLSDVGAKYRLDARAPDAWVHDRHGPPAPRWWFGCQETPYGRARQEWLLSNDNPVAKRLMHDAARLADEAAGWSLGPTGDSPSDLANRFFIHL